MKKKTSTYKICYRKKSLIKPLNRIEQVFLFKLIEWSCAEKKTGKTQKWQFNCQHILLWKHIIIKQKLNEKRIYVFMLWNLTLGNWTQFIQIIMVINLQLMLFRYYKQFFNLNMIWNQKNHWIFKLVFSIKNAMLTSFPLQSANWITAANWNVKPLYDSVAKLLLFNIANWKISIEL